MKRKKHIAVVHCAGGARLNEGIDRASLPKDCSQIMEQYPDGTVDADFTINRANQTRVADRFPLLIQATDNGGVQTILRAQ